MNDVFGKHFDSYDVDKVVLLVTYFKRFITTDYIYKLVFGSFILQNKITVLS